MFLFWIFFFHILPLPQIYADIFKSLSRQYFGRKEYNIQILFYR